MSAARPPGTRRLTVDLDAGLVDWVRAFAELSHRTVEDVVGPLVAAERARVEARWTDGADGAGDAEATRDTGATGGTG
ncbi:hypothetical protein [Kitasatospora sp. NBC_00458]|uniref:hypothetical protein n=1 Tax=Kitasatospora sp. NBC_00458 TaxID=2903568 RepID=UPI002E17AE2D